MRRSLNVYFNTIFAICVGLGLSLVCHDQLYAGIKPAPLSKECSWAFKRVLNPSLVPLNPSRLKYILGQLSHAEIEALSELTEDRKADLVSSGGSHFIQSLESLRSSNKEHVRSIPSLNFEDLVTSLRSRIIEIFHAQLVLRELTIESPGRLEEMRHLEESQSFATVVAKHEFKEISSRLRTMASQIIQKVPLETAAHGVSKLFPLLSLLDGTESSEESLTGSTSPFTNLLRLGRLFLNKNLEGQVLAYRVPPPTFSNSDHFDPDLLFYRTFKSELLELYSSLNVFNTAYFLRHSSVGALDLSMSSVRVKAFFDAASHWAKRLEITPQRMGQLSSGAMSRLVQRWQFLGEMLVEILDSSSPEIWNVRIESSDVMNEHYRKLLNVFDGFYSFSKDYLEHTSRMATINSIHAQQYDDMLDVSGNVAKAWFLFARDFMPGSPDRVIHYRLNALDGRMQGLLDLVSYTYR